MLTEAYLYAPSAILNIRGPDAYSFLQGQFTNDLNRPNESSTYGLWLNQKGKIVADSFVLRRAADDFLAVSQFSVAAEIRQRLENYIIADEVTVQDETVAWGAIDLWGPQAETILGQTLGVVPAPGSFCSAAGGLVFRGRSSAQTNFTLLLPAIAATPQHNQILGAGAASADASTAARERINCGLPAVPADLGPGDLPGEGGLEEAAISFTKGCYLGQEVIARLKNLGRVRRRLHVVEGPGMAPVSGGEVYQYNQRIGEFRSAAPRGDGFVAFAMLSLLNLKLSAGLSRCADGPPEVRIVTQV